MAITSFTRSLITTASPKSDSFLTGNAAYDPGSFASIATFAGGSSSVTFSSIPQTYKHLQLRVMVATSAGVNGLASLEMRVGKTSVDTGANYTYHRIFGNGTSVSADSGTSQTKAYTGLNPYGTGTGSGLYYSVCIIDILDYTDINKYKTIRTLTGMDNNTLGDYWAGLHSNLWTGGTIGNSNNVIDTITFNSNYTYYSNSHFALYGVKG
jgi:hypothetical protein